MSRTLITAIALAIAIWIPAARGLKTCDTESSQKCSVDIARLDYVFHNPGKCMTNECIYKPKRGYTVDPDVKFQAYFQPSKFTKKIAFTFKTLKAEVCAYRNQMCTCAAKETCKCDKKEGSFCKQQYRTEKTYVLVYDDTQKPTRMPYYPPPPPYKPPHRYPPYKYHYFTPPQQTTTPTPPPTPPTPPPPPPPPPPPHSGGYGMYEIPGSNHMGGQSGGNIYQIPMPKKRSMMLNYLIGGGSDSDMMMMNPSMGLFSQLTKGDGDDKKDNSILKYFLMYQLANKKKHYYPPQHHYPHYPPHPPTPPPMTTLAPAPQPTEATTTTEPVPAVGSYFDPKLLMYMMSKNGGGDSKGLYHILPFLLGKGGAKLKLESLYVKIPDGCSCEEKKERLVDPILKYLFLQQGVPFGKFGHPNPFEHSSPKFPFHLFSY